MGTEHGTEQRGTDEQGTDIRSAKFFGWGLVGQGLTPAERDMLIAVARHRWEVTEAPAAPVDPAGIALPAPRAAVPESIAAFTTAAHGHRLTHAMGKSFPDLADAFAGRVAHAPDLVAFPRDESDVVAVLDWATAHDAAVIPFGGGSSVVGGVTPDAGDRIAVSLDLQRLGRVLAVDDVGRAARIQAGVFGPDLARQLQPTGLQLRHYPQSYEHSTLGGWLATRAGGHYATGPTHIDDFVESLRVVTPAGVIETRRLPASGAGPDPNRTFLGSEGSLGVITEAWLRLQPRPVHRAGASVTFREFAGAVAAVREIVQGGLAPANLRLLDKDEAQLAFAGDGSAHVLVLGFESAFPDVGPRLDAALECCADHGGSVERRTSGGAREGSAGAWRDTFLKMPYFRELLVSLGVVAETFETAITWDRFEEFHGGVMAATRAAASQALGGPATVTCRFTHAYPDGLAPYFTVTGRGRPGADLAAQWWEIKRAAAEAIEAGGGTITHHHAVGRDHLPWYRRERPDLWAGALAAARRELDPAGVMNPGVLWG